jgi:hypothetical protein
MTADHAHTPSSPDRPQQLANLAISKLQFLPINMYDITTCLRQGVSFLNVEKQLASKTWSTIESILQEVGLRDMRFAVEAPLGENGKYVNFIAEDTEITHGKISERLKKQYPGKVPDSIEEYSRAFFHGLGLQVRVEDENTDEWVPVFIFDVLDGIQIATNSQNAQNCVRTLSSEYNAILYSDLKPVSIK